MKTFRSGLFAIAVALGLALGELAALGQAVILENYDNWQNWSTNATSGGLLWTNGPDGPGLLQEDVNVTLLGGTSATNLTELVILTLADGSAWGDIIFFGDGVLEDYWCGIYEVPGATASGNAVLELRLWLGNDTNYDAAVASGAAVADTGPFSNPTGGGGSPPSIPPDVTGMPAVILSAPQSQQQSQSGTGGLQSGSVSNDLASTMSTGIGMEQLSSGSYASTDLWLSIAASTNHYANLLLHNTTNSSYELRIKTNLTDSAWTVVQEMTGFTFLYHSMS